MIILKLKIQRKGDVKKCAKVIKLIKISGSLLCSSPITHETSFSVNNHFALVWVIGNPILIC